MHIFIDESGSFAPTTSGSHSISFVGALIVPDHKLRLLIDRYSRLRKRLPKSSTGEVKGRLLDETHVSAVCNLLFKNSCVFEAVGIDLCLETAEGIEHHRQNQAEAITRHLTDRHQPGLVEDLWALRRTLETMSHQLYVQSVVTHVLLGEILEHIPVYFVQRWPKEVGAFHWVIDGKEVGKITTAEKWWSEAMLPMLQSSSQRKPMIQLEGADYRHFDAKFLMDTPEYLKEHGFEPREGVNLRRIMRESFRFSSDPEPGLELVDIVTNATRRALQGNLAPAGWAKVPELMIAKEKQCLKLVHLDVRHTPPLHVAYGKVVIDGFGRGGRAMVV